MPVAPRHAKPKTAATRRWALPLAAVTLSGAAAAFVFQPGGSAAAKPSHKAIPVTSAGLAVADYQMTVAVRRDVAARMVQQASRAAARRRHLAAARHARQQAARQAAAQPPPSPAPARARHHRHPAGAGMPRTRRSGSVSATPRRAAATPGGRVTAAGPTSSCWAPGKLTAARPASTASPAPLTRIRSSTTPSPQVARRTGRVTTGAEAPGPRSRDSSSPVHPAGGSSWGHDGRRCAVRESMSPIG